MKVSLCHRLSMQLAGFLDLVDAVKDPLRFRHAKACTHRGPRSSLQKQLRMFPELLSDLRSRSQALDPVFLHLLNALDDVGGKRFDYRQKRAMSKRPVRTCHQEIIRHWKGVSRVSEQQRFQVLLCGTPIERYEVASFAHIFAMLWPFASTGNLGIQLVSNLEMYQSTTCPSISGKLCKGTSVEKLSRACSYPVAQMIMSTSCWRPSLSRKPPELISFMGDVKTWTLS